MNKSIWKSFLKNEYNPLDKNMDVDVLIIGGGMTGISSLYNLKDTNLKIALVERNIIGSGITSGSTAKITYLQENTYSKLKKYHNIDISKNYLHSQVDAINILKSIIEKNNIDCDFTSSPSYLYALTNVGLKKLNKEKELLKRFGINFKESKTLPDDTKVLDSIYVNNTYTFNPIKYLNSLSKLCKSENTNIYENTKVDNIIREKECYICETNNYKIKAKYIVLALHYPYFLLPFMAPIKFSLEKSYIKMVKENNKTNFNAINLDSDIKSIRYYKDYKLKLFGSHNIAIKNNEIENFNNLKTKNYDYIWSNIDIITNDYLPYIGFISKNMLMATGFNTWGMTNSVLSGKILSDMILKRKNEYKKLFDSKRNINIGKILRTPLILGSNIYSFINSKINRNKSWYKNVIIKNIDGKSVGIYKGNDGKKHYVYTKCPHLGCDLYFNETELTWDCPCHASRFDKDGKCLNGPSNYNITYK